MHRFFLSSDEIGREFPVITGSEAHHLTRVLRCRVGDEIIVLDGVGKEGRAVITRILSDAVHLRVLERFSSGTESPIRMFVAQALLKESKMDEILPRITELGAVAWIPFFSERSVPVPKEKRLENRKKRWEAIARESLKQCRRTVLPEIHAPVSFEGMISASLECGQKIVCYENESLPLVSDNRCGQENKSVFVAFGPEGGFSPSEIRRLTENGFRTVSLGPRILRAQTACVAGCALIQYVYGDMGPDYS